MPNPNDILEESASREERAVVALEQIARGLTLAITLWERVVNHDYPVRTANRDATITRIPSEEDKLREDQGSTGEETVEAWTRLGNEDLGPRERSVISQSKKR